MPPNRMPWDRGHGGWGPGGGPPGPYQQIPATPMPGPGGNPGYQGFGMARMFQNLGNKYDVGSSTPTGGFGFTGQQKTMLNPYLQQLPGLIGQRMVQQEGPSGGPVGRPQDFNLDMSGGILKALQSLGVDTGNRQTLGIGGDQRDQFMHSLQQFINGINRNFDQGGGGGPHHPPNRRPANPYPDTKPATGRYIPPWGGEPITPGGMPPQYYSPGQRNPNIPPIPGQLPPWAYSPGNRNPYIPPTY